MWARMIIRTCGIKVEIEGLEHLRGLKSYILVANHQSFFDIFAVLAYLPGDTRFVAKKELLKIPVVGYAMVAQWPHHRRSPGRRPLDSARAGGGAQRQYIRSAYSPRAIGINDGLRARIQ